MEPITALCIGVGIAAVIGLFIGTIVIPRLLSKSVRKDEDNKPGGSCYNYMPTLDGSEPDLDVASLAPDFDDYEEPMEYYEMPLPADPRARVELSPIEQELREAEEYARRHNRKIKVDEAIDNIKL